MPTSPATLPPMLADWLNILRRRAGAAALVFFGVLAFYVPFIAGLPNLYRASATVLVQGQTAEALVQPSAPGEIDTRLQVIKQEALSRSRLTSLADRFALYPEPEARASAQRLADLMQRDIKVEVVNSEQANAHTNAVAFTVSYVGANPDTVAAVANALAAFYLTQDKQIRSTQATRATEFLGAQLADTKKSLTGQEDRVRAYTMSNQGALSQQTDANVAKLAGLNTQLRANGDEQVRLMERRQALQTQLADVGTRVVADDRDPVTRLARLKIQLTDLRAQWTDGAPDVKRAQEQIAALEHDIAAESARAGTVAAPTTRAVLQASLADTTTQLERLNRDNEAIRNAAATYDRRIESAPAHAAAFQVLTRDYQGMRDRYDSLLRQYDQATLAAKADSTGRDEFRILDEALPIAIPAGPSRVTLLALGIVLALALAMAAAVLRDRLDTSFRSIDDLRAFTAVPVLGSIPVIATKADRVSAVMRSVRVAGMSAAAFLLIAFGASRLGHVGEPVVRLLLRL